MPPAGACLPRSAGNLQAVVALADVERAERYRPREYGVPGTISTFCNVFVSDVTRWLGAEVPHGIGVTWIDERGTHFRIEWQDVRANAEWLRRGEGGWRASDAASAQSLANAGFPAVVVWDAPMRAHGHIAVLVPQGAGDIGVTIAQAGAALFSHGQLARGFGSHGPLEYFVHE